MVSIVLTIIATIIGVGFIGYALFDWIRELSKVDR